MTGAELYAMIDVATIAGDPDADEKQKAAIIKILSNALKTEYERGVEDELDRWQYSS